MRDIEHLSDPEKAKTQVCITGISENKFPRLHPRRPPSMEIFNKGCKSFEESGKLLGEKHKYKMLKHISLWFAPPGGFFIQCGRVGKKVINIFKHPICDANIWHHKTNVKIQPFWREIGEKWQFKMEMYVLSISPLQWDGRNIKYRKGEKFGINLEERIIHGEWKSAGVGMCKC